MLTLDVVNELTLRVTCTGMDSLFVKKGAFIAGECMGQKNYTFEKVLLGPQQDLGAALLGSLVRRVTGENIPLMKVNLNGDSITYYANYGQHVIVYKLEPGETISVESENLLAFTPDCDYSVRFIGVGVLSQKGLATTTLTARGANPYDIYKEYDCYTKNVTVIVNKNLPPTFESNIGGVTTLYQMMLCQQNMPER